MPQQPVYLNQAGTSWPKPQCVVEALHAATSAEPADWPNQFATAHQSVARFMGIDDPSRLLLTPGCTSALAIAIADLDLQAGQRILSSGLEHHALYRPLAALSKLGITLTTIPPTLDCPLDLQRMAKELADPNVRLVAVCEYCNVTGDRLPIEEIAALAHTSDAILLVDGAQGAGWDKISLSYSEIDIYVFGSLKQMHSSWGVGGLYIAPTVQMNTPTASCALPAQSVGNGKNDTITACTTMPGYCDGGSVDRIALAGLGAACNWLSSPERNNRFSIAQARAEKLRSAISRLPQVQHYGIGPEAARAPTIAFNIGRLPSNIVANELFNLGIIAASGHQCAPQVHHTLGTFDQGVVRLSVGAMTTDQDIENATLILQTAHGAFLRLLST